MGYQETETERIIKDAGMVHEVRRNENVGIPSAVTFWGIRTDCADINRQLQGMLPGQLISSPGFECVYRTAPFLSPDETVRQEMAAVKVNLAAILDVLDPEDRTPEVLSVGCGTPPFAHYGKAIAEMMGLGDIEVIESNLACNSGARAMQRILEEPRYAGKRAIVVGIEGMTRLIADPKLNLAKADPFSLQAFGNGIGAVSFIPERDISLVQSISLSEEDTEGNLTARPTYLIDPEGPLIQISGSIEKTKLPIPEEEGKIIHIKPTGTSKMFIRAAEATVDNLLTGYREQIASGTVQDKPIRLVAAHHPSRGVWDIFMKKLERKGIPAESCPWIVPEGNLSGATSTVALCRLLPVLSPGDRIILLGYGAGWSSSGMICDIGGK